VKRHLAVAALALLAATGLSGCSRGDDTVLTVNGEVLLDQAQMDDLLQQFNDDEDWLTSQDGRGDGRDTLSMTPMVVPALNNYVIADLLGDELDRLAADTEDDVDFERQESDEASGLQLLVQGFSIPIDVEEGETPSDDQLRDAVDDFIPPRYREVMLDFATQAAAFQRYITDATAAGAFDTDDPNQAQQDFLTRMFEEADVDVAGRYGEWDPATNQIEPPEGPLAPATTLPVALPAGG
jgi:hypothetical protein